MEEKILFGVIILVGSLISIILQLLTVPVFLLYSEYRSITCFKIMLSIGIMDTVQSISHVLMALGMIFNWRFDGFFGNIIGAILFAAFMAAVLQHLILAVNRLLVVVEVEASQYEFINTMILYTLLAASWLWATLFLLINLSPMSGIIFYENGYTFDYSSTIPWAETVSEVDFWSTVPSPVIGLCIYTFIIFKLVLKRKKYNLSTPTMTESNKFLTKSEIKLIIQSLMGYLFAGILFASYHISDYFSIRNSVFALFMTLFWILFCCVGPILYLTMNRKIRQRAFLLLKFSLERKIVPMKKILSIHTCETPNHFVKTSIQ